jgi:hypothetical protein
MRRKISRTHHPNVDSLYITDVPLFHEIKCLWQASSTNLVAQNIERQYFRYELPLNLPPSYHAKEGRADASVVYRVEAAGLRAGSSRRRCRAALPFAVVPQGTSSAIETRNSLRLRWTGQYNYRKFERLVRQGLWGDYSTVIAEVISLNPFFTLGSDHMQIFLPAVAAYPMTTTFPFRLKVTTKTKPMKLSESQDATSVLAKGLFPEVPASPSAVTLQLVQMVDVRSKGEKSGISGTVIKNLGGFGLSPLGAVRTTARTEVDEPQWAPVDAHKDARVVCTRSVVFHSLMSFSCPPSFTTSTITCKVSLIAVPDSGR